MIYGKLKSLLANPYPLNTGFKSNAPFLAGFSTVIPLYLIIFGPLGLKDSDWPYKDLMLAGIGVVIFSVVSLNFAILPKLLPKIFSDNSWTVGREIIWQSLDC